MSDAFDDILAEAVATKKNRAIGHFFREQMKSCGKGSVLTPQQWDKLMDLALNPGPASECDEDGFTPDNHALAKCCEAFYRHKDAGTPDAIKAAVEEVPIDNGDRDPEDTLWAVIGGERPRVRALLITRKTWRQPKRRRK